ncbi:DUF2804 domain-containing protein [Alkalimarinus alittae]|uniref:DUF2804 domain-containing protein n=1 Tax=Alkalimarinus alittae TaxID=2961619 RepID=A0ABY6N4K4_9ALTE|nr:DUF2804 domain-containing protein [Alkalimarinus alittae]UZE96970.1 DUF2804 domain-containing protein [Alkalimarinus alittae]
MKKPTTTLIQDNGSPIFGEIHLPVSEVNYLKYDLRTPMDKPIEGVRKRMAFNQFQFIGVMSEDIIAGIAIVDLKLVSNVFVYVYDLKTGVLVEKSLLQPLSIGTIIETRPDTGKSVFKQLGSKVEITTNESGSERYIAVSLGRNISINATMFQPQEYAPLRVCSKAGYNGWVYTQKTAGLAVKGVIRCSGKEYILSPETSSASSDWSCGFMRRETAWNWASFSGMLADGRRVGLNLAAGVNETGVTENCLWVDGTLTKLNMAIFEFDRYQPENSWQVRTTDGLLALTFQPMGKREEKINALVIASNFKQVFGYFSGWMIDSSGEKIALERIPGFMEDHYAKW